MTPKKCKGNNPTEHILNNVNHLNQVAQERNKKEQIQGNDRKYNQ